jgi:hypothetical protein
VWWWEECYKRCGGGRGVIRGGLLYNGMELYIHYKFTSLSQLICYFNIYCWLLTTKLSPLIWIWFLDSYLKCYELKTCQIAQEFHQSVCYKLCWLSSQYQSGSHNIALQLLTVLMMGLHYRDRITTYAISAHHHWGCEFKSRSREVYSLQHYVACRWFSPGTPVSFTNKTNRHAMI